MQRKIPINWEKIERNFLYDDYEMGISYYFDWMNLKEAVDEMEDIEEKLLTLMFINKIIKQYDSNGYYKDLGNKINEEIIFLEKENSLSNLQIKTLQNEINQPKDPNTKGLKRIKVSNKDRAILQKEIDSKCPFCPSEDVGHFEVHHIDENRNNNILSNLLMVCPTCHSKIGKSDISAKEVMRIKVSLSNGK